MFYLFDMDGVLVRSAPATMRAAMEVLSEYGIRAKKEDFAPFIGAGEARFVGGVAEQYGVAYEPVMKDKVYEKYLQYVETDLEKIPFAPEIICALKERGEKVALSSSADMVKIRANMKAAGISLDWFDVITCGEDAERKKPFPDIFLATAEKLGADPADCLVIEDALTGIQAAKAAGMRCVAITTFFSRDQLIEGGADRVIDSLKELSEI